MRVLADVEEIELDGDFGPASSFRGECIQGISTLSPLAVSQASSHAGEQTAQSCENAWLRQSRKEKVQATTSRAQRNPTTMLRTVGLRQ